MQETPVRFLGQEDPLEKGQATHSSILRLPCGSAGKECTCIVGDLGSIPGLERSLGEWKGYPLQYSGPENSMDCIIHWVPKSRTWLSEFHFHWRRWSKKVDLSSHLKLPKTLEQNMCQWISRHYIRQWSARNQRLRNTQDDPYHPHRCLSLLSVWYSRLWHRVRKPRRSLVVFPTQEGGAGGSGSSRVSSYRAE